MLRLVFCADLYVHFMSDLRLRILSFDSFVGSLSNSLPEGSCSRNREYSCINIIVLLIHLFNSFFFHFINHVFCDSAYTHLQFRSLLLLSQRTPAATLSAVMPSTRSLSCISGSSASGASCPGCSTRLR